LKDNCLLRCVFVVPSLRIGGAQGAVLLLCQQMAKRGHEVHLIVCHASLGEESNPINENFRIHRLLVGEVARNFAQALLLPLRLRRLIRSIAPSVVIGFLDKAYILVLASCIGLDIPIVASERTLSSKLPINVLWSFLRSALMWRVSAVVGVCRASVEALPPFVTKNRVVIPGPVDSCSTHISALGPTRVVAVGRLSYEKGFDLLLRASQIVEAKCPNLEFILIGEGPERRNLQNLKTDRTTLLGTRSRPFDEISVDDIFVCPSRFEGYPRALAEAMMQGLAVIATKSLGGVADMIQHEVNGLLVSPEDPRALAEAIQRLISDPTLRKRLGQNAKKIREVCSTEVVVPRWEALLQSLATE